ncbi:MAG: CvpA family protein [Alphaproteobacteria bacterium]|nr:CvpA family protein [Alphaproteobacteria bacterium]MBF0251392.1 CvpA family protein [Alphaproteobacteria bacterium]
MHWIDILVIGTLAISGLFAFARGFVHEVLSIAGWVGAFFAAAHGAPVVQHFAMQFIEDPGLAYIVTWIGLFLGALIILSLVTRRISTGVKESALGALDRVLGFIFGLLRGAIVVSLAWIAYEWYLGDEKPPKSVFEARSLPYVIQGADTLRALVPEDKNHKPSPGQPPKTGEKPQSDGQSLFDKAINAVPKMPATDEKPDGYDNKERSEMDRLFETSQ